MRPRPEIAESGLGIASAILLLPAALLLLVARALSGEPFVVTSAWAYVFCGLGVALAVGGAVARERRHRVGLVALALHGGVIALLVEAIPARDPRGNAWAGVICGAIVCALVLGGMAHDRHRERRARQLAEALGLRRRGKGKRYSAVRDGVSVEVEVGSTLLLRVRALQSSPIAFLFAAAPLDDAPPEPSFCDEDLRELIESWLESSTDAVVECRSGRSAICAIRSVPVLTQAELEKAVAQGSGLVLAMAARVAAVGPISLLDGPTILLRKARLAEHPSFQAHFDLRLADRAPVVALQLEQDKCFSARIEPSPEEKSLAGKWLRLRFSLTGGEEVTLDGELFDDAPSEHERPERAVHFPISSLQQRAK